MSSLPSVPARPERHASQRQRTCGSTDEVLLHLALALSAHERRVRIEGAALPDLVTEMSRILRDCVSTRQGATPVDAAAGRGDDVRMSSPMLVSKGDAARLLSVSLRTVERMIAAGRLPVIHIEGASRIRMADIASFVEALPTEPPTDARDPYGNPSSHDEPSSLKLNRPGMSGGFLA